MSRPTETVRHLVSCALLVAAAGIAAPASAEDIAQTPLFLGISYKPNFIFAIDDSYSMLSDRTFIGGDATQMSWNPATNSLFVAGQPGTFFVGAETRGYLNVFTAAPSAGEVLPPGDAYGFARSPEFNTQYFNPAIQYLPWAKADGGRWPKADPKATKYDPRPDAVFAPANTVAVDLADPAGRAAQDGVDSSYEYLPGMTVPAGTVYRAFGVAGTEFCKGGIVATDDQWEVLASDTPISDQSCKLFERTFLPRFYLGSATGLPANYGYKAAPVEVSNAFGPGSTSLWRFDIRPENFASAAQYDAAIQNFADWFQYHRTRFLSLIASTTESLTKVVSTRIGTFKINDRIPVQMYDMDVPVDRAALFNDVTSLQATAIIKGDPNLAGTPNRDAVAHIGTQYARTDVNAPIQANCQVNAGMLFTYGATSVGSGPAGYGNADGALVSPLPDTFADTMADIVASLYGGARVPLRADMPQSNVEVPSSCPTDDPRVDCVKQLHMNFHGVVYGPTGKIYGVEAQPTADPFAFPPDWNKLGNPRIVGGPVAVDEIWHASLNGRGTFANAQNPQAVSDAINSAITATAKIASTSGGVGASSSRRDEGFLSYVPHYAMEDRTGDLVASALNQQNKYVDVWSAAAKLEDMKPEDRKIYFNDQGTLKEFVTANLGDEATAVARLGLPSVKPYGGTVDDAIRYLRGDHTKEKKMVDGVFRDRRARIGDIFGSQVEVLTPAGYGYSGLPQDQGGGVDGPGSYGEFLQTTKKDRVPVAFVGANDGMLHAFDATAGALGGTELFAVIPASVQGNLGLLPDPAYGHHYFVDGSPVQGDAWNGQWKTVLLTPMGGGGNSLMALDVTDPAKSFDEKSFLWEFTDPDLNLTLGKAHIVLLANGKWAAVFGGGIALAPDEKGDAFVFVVELFSGKLIQKIQLRDAAYNPNADDGVMSLVPVDTDFDLKADVVYAGDMDGQLWRIDIPASGPAVVGNGGKALFRAIDAKNRAQRITGGLDAFPHHIRGQSVFFGTGRFLVGFDGAPPYDSESFYSIWDDPTAPGLVTRSDLSLRKIVAEENIAGQEVRRITETPVDWATQRGWALDLAVEGVAANGREMVISQPVVALGKVVFASISPSRDPCRPGVINRLYSLSATSGVGEFAFPGSTQNYGAIEIPGASGNGPILSPTLITSPPAPACLPGSPDCPVLKPDDNGNVLAAPSAGCITPLGVLLGDSMLNFDALTCGRQSWQQLQ